MAILMPEPLGEYIAASNVHDKDGMLRCFTPDAVVEDEGAQYRGAAEIKQWIDKTVDAYQHVIEVLEVETDGDQAVVDGRVSGNFDGSPIVIRFHFTLRDNLIATIVSE